MSSQAPRGIVAEFYKSPGGRLELQAITTLITETAQHDGSTYLSRTGYIVDWSRTYDGYIWRETSGGGDRTIEVSGIYFMSGDVQVKEMPVQLVDAYDKPPWTGKRTLAIRKRNRTRRLTKLPKTFHLEDGQDLIDWMEYHAVQDDAVYCSTCHDHVRGEDLCNHIWWCDSTGDYSTPDERCKCKSRAECNQDVEEERQRA